MNRLACGDAVLFFLWGRNCTFLISWWVSCFKGIPVLSVLCLLNVNNVLFAWFQTFAAVWMRSYLFWDVTRQGLGVSYWQTIQSKLLVSAFKDEVVQGKDLVNCLNLEDGIGCLSRTLVTTNLRCVTSQKSEDLNLPLVEFLCLLGSYAT